MGITFSSCRKGKQGSGPRISRSKGSFYDVTLGTSRTKGLPLCNARHSSGIYKLPDDCLILIFQIVLEDEDDIDRTGTLLRLTEVCPWWRHAILKANRLLWEDVHVVGHRITDSVLLHLASTLGSAVQDGDRLRKKVDGGSSSSELALVSEYTSIDTSYGSAGPGSLTLRSCHKVTANGLYKALAHFGASLTALHITACSGVIPSRTASRSSKSPLVHSKALQTFALHGGWSGRDIVSFLSPVGGSLQRLDLANCYNHSARELEECITMCPNIKEVNLSHCYTLNDEVLSMIVHSCRHLEVVQLTGCRDVTARALGALFEALPSLRKLDISGCTGMTRTQLAGIPLSVVQACQQLEELKFDFVRSIDDSFLLKFKSPRLHSISLWNCREVTGRGIVALLRQNPRLATLVLSGCSGVAHVPPVQGIPRHNLVTSVALQFADVPVPVLHALVKRFPHLQDLSIDALSREAEKKLLQDRPQLAVHRV